MTLAGNPEILTFAARVLERHGGVVEQQSDSLFTLLPHSLSRSLDVPEEVRLGGEGEPLSYGSHVLERLVNLVTGDVPVAYGQLKVPYIKKGGFEQLLSRDVALVNASARLISRAEVRTTYMILACHYVALSDERKEGLVQVSVHEGGGTSIPDLNKHWQEFQAEYFPPGKAPPHFPAYPQGAVTAALKDARKAAEAELGGFFNSMSRHLRRDVQNTQEYYKALEDEMKTDLKRQNLTLAQREEREAKIRELPQEMVRKIDDLRQKYKVEVTLTACAALRLLVPVAQISLELKRHAFRRQLHLIYNPVTQRLDPLACDRCGVTTRRVHACDEASQIQLYCTTCSQK